MNLLKITCFKIQVEPSFTMDAIQHCIRKTFLPISCIKTMFLLILKEICVIFPKSEILVPLKNSWESVQRALVNYSISLHWLVTVAISDATAKRWLSILEASYIVYLLQPYHNNLGKRLIKTLSSIFTIRVLHARFWVLKKRRYPLHPLRGSLFEALIISEIMKWHLTR